MSTTDSPEEPLVSFADVAAEEPAESVRHEDDAFDDAGDPDAPMPDEVMQDEVDAAHDQGVGFPMVGAPGDAGDDPA